MMLQNFIFSYLFHKDFIFYHSVIQFLSDSKEGQTASVVHLHDQRPQSLLSLDYPFLITPSVCSNVYLLVI